MSRAAAEIEPVSRMLSSSLTLPGPSRAPVSKTMLTLSRAMSALCHARRLQRSFSVRDARPGSSVSKIKKYENERQCI